MDNIGPQWFWLMLAGLFAALELVVPSRSLIWVAGAALITALLAWAFPFGPAVESVIFALLAVAATFAGRVHLRRQDERRETGADSAAPRRPDAEEDPLHLVGHHARVSAEIKNGEGRVYIAGSEWVAHGPDAHAGALVRVVAREDAVLLVE